jgi:hypothetical protein
MECPQVDTSTVTMTEDPDQEAGAKRQRSTSADNVQHLTNRDSTPSQPLVSMTLEEKVEYLLNKVATLETSNQGLLEEIRVLTEQVTRIKVPQKPRKEETTASTRPIDRPVLPSRAPADPARASMTARSYAHVATTQTPFEPSAANVTAKEPLRATASKPLHPSAASKDQRLQATLRSKLRAQPTEQRLKTLLMQPRRPHTPTPVGSLLVNLSLRSSAREDKVYAVKTVIHAQTGCHIVDANIINPTLFEIFLPVADMETVARILRQKAQLHEQPHLLSAKDLRRRAATYNRAKDSFMREANLAGFPQDLQLELLAIASSRIPQLPTHRRQEVQEAILRDQEMLQL